MDGEKDKTKGEEIHEEIQKIRYQSYWLMSNYSIEWLSEAKRQNHSRVHALKSLQEPRTKAMRLKDQFVSQLRFLESQQERAPVVRVPRPGTDMKWEFTKESLIFTAPQALWRRSLISELILALMWTLLYGNNELSELESSFCDWKNNWLLNFLILLIIFIFYIY